MSLNVNQSAVNGRTRSRSLPPVLRPSGTVDAAGVSDKSEHMDEDERLKFSDLAGEGPPVDISLESRQGELYPSQIKVPFI